MFSFFFFLFLLSSSPPGIRIEFGIDADHLWFNIIDYFSIGKYWQKYLQLYPNGKIEIVIKTLFHNLCCQTNKIATIQHKTDLRTLRARRVLQSQLLQFQVLTTLLSDLAGLYICKFTGIWVGIQLKLCNKKKFQAY